MKSLSVARPANKAPEKRKCDSRDGKVSAFPLRVAGIDIGSNAIRFLVAEFSAPGRYRAIESQRLPVRLGHDVFLSGRMTPAAMDAAVGGIKAFCQSLDQSRARLIRAVATSAVREAKNGTEFVGRLKTEVGLDLEVIPGAEEARLVHLALRNRLSMGANRWISVDVGGGSVEVSLVDADGIIWSESHAMGSVRLLEELSGSGDEPGRFRRLISEYLSNLRLPMAAERYRPVGLIATGGNIESLVKLAGGRDNPDQVGVISLAGLRGAIETLARMSYRQRVEELGLRDDRADVILPGAMVYERVATLAGVEEILVPYVGVRDGVVLDLVEHHLSPVNSDSRREQ